MPTKTRINGENYTQLTRMVSDDIILKGLPQTAGAPAGYGDLASAIYDLINSILTVPVESFGALNTGLADASDQINAAYDYARANGYAAVSFGPGTFLANKKIDAFGVSTIGIVGSKLKSVVPASEGSAFRWGGSGTFVTGMEFELSNTTTETPMQGVYNPISNVSDQYLTRNKITCLTSRASGASNIYGAWFDGAGLSAVHCHENEIIGASYGIQLNNQAAGGADVNVNPIGSPSTGFFVSKNKLVDCAIGVNTPHIFMSDVFISKNEITFSTKQVDMPINLAHVNCFDVSGNTVICSKAAINGVVHLEDAVQNGFVSMNYIKTTAANVGVYLSQQVGVSGDDPATGRVTITDNIVEGSTSSGAIAGILIPDANTFNCTVSDNKISNFGIGVESVGVNFVRNNELINCGSGVKFATSTASTHGNVFRGCTNIAVLGVNAVLCIEGGEIYGATFSFSKGTNSCALLSNVSIRHESATTFAAGTPFNLFTCPATYKFTGTANILISNMGFSKHTFTWDGAAFTPARVADAQLSSVGGITLSKSAAMIQGTAGTASGSGTIVCQIDGMVY